VHACEQVSARLPRFNESIKRLSGSCQGTLMTGLWLPTFNTRPLFTFNSAHVSVLNLGVCLCFGSD
jgi:hypothetical protein